MNCKKCEFLEVNKEGRLNTCSQQREVLGMECLLKHQVGLSHILCGLVQELVNIEHSKHKSTIDFHKKYHKTTTFLERLLNKFKRDMDEGDEWKSGGDEE